MANKTIDETRLKSVYHDLIRIESISGHERRVGEYIAQQIRGFGLEPRFVYFDDDRARPSIYTRFGDPSNGRSLLLIGHTDTVGINSPWDTDPFEPVEVGDRTYGRGAMDMKGGIAAILETVAFFCKNPHTLSGEIIAAFVADEEVLSQGSFALLREDIHPDMAIMAECRFDNVAAGFRGRYSIEVKVQGESAHSSHYPEKGENAIASAARLILALEGLEEGEMLRHPKLGIGSWCAKYVEGGIRNALTVPDQCSIIFDRFFVKGETFATMEQQVRRVAAKLGIEKKIAVKKAERKLPYMEPFAIDEAHPIISVLREKYREITGKELDINYDPSVIDSNILVNEAGIPTATFGPSGGNMHGANEYGYFQQVAQCAHIYIETAKELLKPNTAREKIETARAERRTA
ncbi:M20/M25/M40 family metallo-hydrolase [Synergistaceae bacterium OttesenSCG-928-I11]|nr:M20/M25/M40 family metallo-hydrolase [Synergistaceae bacterium OttesenSCG-928-I11]